MCMSGVGIGDIEIKRINHKAMVYRKLIASNPEASAMVPTLFRPEFSSMPLPPMSATLSEWAERGTTDPDFLSVCEYLFGRGDAISGDRDYYWTPHGENQMNKRLLIPFTYHGMIVGWSGRLVGESNAGNGAPKYWTKVPTNYIFNNQFLEGDRKFVILTEGPFDAIAVDGVA